MPTEANNGNGRVTMAVLGEKIDRLSKDMQEVKREVKEANERITEHCMDAAKIETQVHDNTKEIDGLRKKSDGWNILNTIGVFGAGLLGWLK